MYEEGEMMDVRNGDVGICRGTRVREEIPSKSIISVLRRLSSVLKCTETPYRKDSRVAL